MVPEPIINMSSDKQTYEQPEEPFTQPIEDFIFPTPNERTYEPTERSAQDLPLSSIDERTYEQPEETTTRPMEEHPQEPTEEHMIEEQVQLSQISNTRRRSHDEEQQLGRDQPLQRDPQLQEGQGLWPSRNRSLLIYLKNFEILQPGNDVMLEGQFANLEDIVNITRRIDSGNHVFTVQGPLQPLPRARWPIYILEVTG